VPFPTTLSGVDFLAVASQGRSKPYISSIGNLYVFLKDDFFADRMDVYKATDPTDSFTEETFLALADTGVLRGIATFQDGDNIHITTQDDNEVILYHIFSMSSDSFTTSNQVVTAAVGTDVDAEKAISISLSEDESEILIFFQADSDNDMGQKERVRRAWKISGSWTVGAVDGGGAINYFLGGVVRGEADKFHFGFLANLADPFIPEHKSAQDVDGTLSALEEYGDFITGANSEDFQLVPGVYYDDDGVERITLAFHRPAATAAEFRSSLVEDDGTPAVDSLITHTGDDEPFFNGQFAVVVLAVDEKTVWGLWSRSNDGQDLWSAKNVDDAGFTDRNEELDAVTINLVTSNVYQRGSDVVLAIVYLDGTTVKYTEKVLRTIAAEFLPKKPVRQYLRM